MTPRRVLLLAAAVGAALWGRHRMATWGTTPDDRDRPMPGDDLVPDPLTQVTRAIRIAAPAEQVCRGSRRSVPTSWAEAARSSDTSARS